MIMIEEEKRRSLHREWEMKRRDVVEGVGEEGGCRGNLVFFKKLRTKNHRLEGKMAEWTQLKDF